MPNPFLKAIFRTASLFVLALAPVLSSHSAANTVSYGYDALGRLNKVTYADGTVTFYSYDLAGNRTASGKPPTSILSLSACNSVTPAQNGNYASMSCTVGNSGSVAANLIQYQSNIPSMVFASAPTTCAAKTANCGLVTLWTPTTPGTYSNVLVATASDGSTASVPYSLTVYSTAVLSLSACTSATPSTLPATSSMTCVLGNSGQSNVSVTYGLSVNTGTVSGPSTCAGNSANCGSVKVTAPATAGTYSGYVYAVPAAGLSAAAGFNLVDNLPPPALSLVNCNAYSPAPNSQSASLTCTLSNTGSTPAAGITYSTTGGGMTSSGPSSCAGNTANCGTVMTYSTASPGNYAGTLSVSPSGGGGTSVGYNLTVSTYAALTLSCSSKTPSVLPSTSSMTCVVGNTGQSPAINIGYGPTIAGMTMSTGPANCAGNTSNCGSITVTAPQSAGTYSGNLIAVPAVGANASAPFSLVNTAPPTAAFTVVSSTGYLTTFKNPNSFAVTPSSSGMDSDFGAGFAYVSSNTCTSAVAAGGTCSISISAAAPDCKMDNYTFRAYVSDAGGTAYGTQLLKTSTSSICR